MAKAEPIKFTSSANMVLKDIGEGLRPDSVDAGVLVSARAKAQGISYNLTATEATVRNARALSGAWLSMSKPLGARAAEWEGGTRGAALAGRGPGGWAW